MAWPSWFAIVRSARANWSSKRWRAADLIILGRTNTPEFGLKPTRARTPTGPFLGEAWNGFAIEHALTRSLRDSAALLDATHGADVGAPYHAPAPARPYLTEVSTAPGQLRIAFSGKPLLGKQVDAQVLDGLAQTAKPLESLGHELVQAASRIDSEAFSMAFLTILAAQLRADTEEAARAAGKKVSVNDFDPSTFGLGMLGKSWGASEYVAAVRYLQIAAREVAEYFEHIDFFLTPTLAHPLIQIPPQTGEIPIEKCISSRQFR